MATHIVAHSPAQRNQIDAVDWQQACTRLRASLANALEGRWAGVGGGNGGRPFLDLHHRQ